MRERNTGFHRFLLGKSSWLTAAGFHIITRNVLHKTGTLTSLAMSCNDDWGCDILMVCVQAGETRTVFRLIDKCVNLRCVLNSDKSAKMETRAHGLPTTNTLVRSPS